MSPFGRCDRRAQTGGLSSLLSGGLANFGVLMAIGATIYNREFLYLSMVLLFMVVPGF